MTKTVLDNGDARETRKGLLVWLLGEPAGQSGRGLVGISHATAQVVVVVLVFVVNGGVNLSVDGDDGLGVSTVQQKRELKQSASWLWKTFLILDGAWLTSSVDGICMVVAQGESEIEGSRSSSALRSVTST